MPKPARRTRLSKSLGILTGIGLVGLFQVGLFIYHQIGTTLGGHKNIIAAVNEPHHASSKLPTSDSPDAFLGEDVWTAAGAAKLGLRHWLGGAWLLKEFTSDAPACNARDRRVAVCVNGQLGRMTDRLRDNVDRSMSSAGICTLWFFVLSASEVRYSNFHTAEHQTQTVTLSYVLNGSWVAGIVLYKHLSQYVSATVEEFQRVFPHYMEDKADRLTPSQQLARIGNHGGQYANFYLCSKLVAEHEAASGQRFDWVLKLRDDSHPLGDSTAMHELLRNPTPFLASHVWTKNCHSWNGVNDRAWVLPRSLADRALRQPFISFLLTVDNAKHKSGLNPGGAFTKLLSVEEDESIKKLRHQKPYAAHLYNIETFIQRSWLAADVPYAQLSSPIIPFVSGVLDGSGLSTECSLDNILITFFTALRGKRLLLMGDSRMENFYKALTETRAFWIERSGMVQYKWCNASASCSDRSESCREKRSCTCSAKSLKSIQGGLSKMSLWIPPETFGGPRDMLTIFFYLFHGLGDVTDFDSLSCITPPKRIMQIVNDTQPDYIVTNTAHDLLGRTSRGNLWTQVMDFLARWAKSNNSRTVAFSNHPPQHFDTESGSYPGPGVATNCSCNLSSSALRGQPEFRAGQLLRNEATGRGLSYVDFWEPLVPQCDKHMGGDCMHFSASARRLDWFMYQGVIEQVATLFKGPKNAV